MMTKILSFLLFCFVSSHALAVNTYELFDLRAQQVITMEQFSASLDDDALIMLGETHYRPAIMQAQGYMIEQVVQYGQKEGAFTVAWEFMNYPDQGRIEGGFHQYVKDEISFEGLLSVIFPGQKPEQNFVYEPLFSMAKKYRGEVLATNAPRPWKRIVVAQGIEALPVEKVPSFMERGPDDYYERFIQAMGGHGDPAAIEGFFMAQSYTDAVMAEQLVKAKQQLQFMIVGNFHTNYGHGLPFYLEAITNRQLVNVRLIDSAAISEQELLSFKEAHKDYGYIGDYLLIVR